MARTKQTARKAAPPNLFPIQQQVQQEQMLQQQTASHFSEEEKTETETGSETPDSDEEEQQKNMFSSNLVRPNRRRRDEVAAGPQSQLSTKNSQAIRNAYNRLQLERNALDGKFDSLLKQRSDSQILCCSDGPGEFDNTLPLWTSLWTDMTLKSFAKELAKKDSAQFFQLSFRGEAYITDQGIRWLCEAFEKERKDPEKIKKVQMNIDLQHCPAITKNSIAHLFRTFSSASVVKTDIADKMDDDDLKKNKELAEELAVSSLLFVSLPEVQFSAMSAVKEGKLKAAGGRGAAVDDKFMKVGDAHVVATELCLSAYNLQYFPSQPDQVVIVVLNDFDRAVGHIAETLVTYLSKANPVLKQPDPATRRKLATASDASIPNIPDKPKVDRKGGADVEADDKIEMVKGPEYHHVGVKQVEKWILPMEECNSMFVSNNELDIRKPSSVFSVVVADCKECTVGLIRMDPKWFEFSQKFHSFSDLYERAIVKLEFSDSGKEFKLSCVKDDGVMSIPATWKTDTFVSDKDNFVVSIEVRKGALSGESNMVNIVLNKATVHQFIVKSSALSRGGSVQKKGKVSQTVHEGVFGYASCAKGKADDVGFYLLPDSASPVYSSVGGGPPVPDLAKSKVSAGAEATSSAAVESDPSVGTPLHTPPFRVLCHRMSSSSSAASSTAARIREGVAAELKRVRDQATASLEVEEKRLAESGGGGGGEFLRQLRWSELSGTAERIQAYLETRIGDDLELFGTDQLPELRAALAATSQAAVEALLPDRLWRIRHVKEALKAATEGSGRGRICALDCLKEADEKFGRRQLVEALQWLHERGSLIFLRHLSLIVTDLPWFFDLLESLPFDPPLVAGPLLPGLEPDAGVWSEATLAQALKAAGVTSAEEPHLRRILADSGALVPLAPLRRSAEDERLFYTNLYCAAGRRRKALDWPLFTHAQLPAGSEPVAAYRVYRGIVRPVERALPALFGLTSRLGQLCRCSASGFVRSLWGVEIVVAHVTKSGDEDGAGADGRNGELHLTAWLPVAAASGKMSSAQRASTRQLLWSALHLFTDALDALLLRQGCLGVQVQSSADGEKEESGEPENRSLTCRHSWDPASPEAGHAPSVCVLCGNCARAGPACRFNRIDSGIGGVARCLCEPAVRRACATCGVCADCVATAWALHACVHPNRALPGSINLSTGGDGGSDLRRALSRRRLRLDDQGPAVELCPRLSLQSASKPEVTFCRNQLIAQDELIVCLKDTSTSGLIQVYPEVNVLEKDLEFKSKPQSLDYSVDISFRLSPANLPEDLSLSDAQSSAEQMPRYNYSAKSNSYLWQDAGLLAYSCVGDRSSQLPVGLLIGQSPLTGGSDTFTIKIVSRGAEGTISIGLVPFGYHTTSQPGWRAGSIGYHGDDGGLFLSSGQSTRRLEPFSAESSLPGCQVRCQLKPVSGRLRCIFSLDRRGVGDFVEVSSEPVEPPAGGFFACVGMHSPGEIVQLVDSAAWRPAAAETSAAVAGAVGSEDSGQEREPFDSVRYQLASVWPQLELPCHVQSVGLRGGNRGISGVLSGLLMIELRTSEPTQIRVISSGSVRCHLVTRAASGDSASAQSESESSWQSLLEMLGSIEEKRAPQFQGKGGGGKAAALTFKKKGGGGKGEQKEQEDEANSDADEDDKAERELVVNASRKDGQRFVCIRVLAPLHGAAAARAAASGQVSEMAEADKSLKGHDTVEVVVSGYGESQQRHKVQLRLLTPSELAAAGSQHQRRLFAVPFTEENARQAGGPCDLLEVLDSGVPLNRLLVPRRGWSLVFNRKAMAALHVRAENFPALNFSSSLQRGHWLRYTENSNSGDRALYRVTEVDDKEVSIKSLSVLNASATKVKLDSANLESPQLADLVSMSAASLANPEVLLPRFPSPNALGNWNRKSRHKFISNESFLYGHSCQFFRHRTVAGLGLSTVSSLLSGATRSNVGGGLLWVFLPQPGRLHRLGLAELGRPEQLRAHLLCCSGPTEVHLIDSAGIGHSMTSALECHQSAQPAIRQLLRNRLAIPSHKLLAPGGDADEAAASALSQELLQSRLWIEAAVRQHLLSGYSAAHWHSVSSVGHAAAAAAPAAGDATAAAADAASSSEPEVDSQQRQLVQQLMAAYVTPPPATQPDKLYAAGRLAPAACRAHLLCLTEGLLDEALEADPAGGVSAALRPYAECVRSARLMASTRLTDTASLTELTCLETLALIRLPGLRSLGPAGQLPTGRLRSLQVTKCDLESADAAAACPNLKSLSFSATKLATLPDSWKPDSPLETLTIDCCPMAALPASLGRLRHLRTLRLSQLPLRTLPPELASLQTLEELAVDGVAWPDSLMDNLTSGSHVTDGHKFLTAQRGVSMATGADQQEQQQRYFSALLTDAQVASISQSESLPATLARLVLEVPRLGADAPAEDEFGGLPPCLFELTNLKTLQLNYQAIRRIPDAIVRLRRLQSLQLSSNPLLESLSPRLAELPSLNHVDVGRCPALRTPPLEVVQRGSAALLSYLKFLASDQVECKRTKLMFVGLGGVGKTSLLRALRDPDNKTTAMGSEEITDGIDIGDWTIDIGDGSQPLNFSTWDFAGQKVYYNTHQFFLTHRAVYLLLYTVRTGYEHAGLDFWLSSISSHAPNAPILVVGTHSDQVEKGDNLPQDTFQARYPQIYNFHQVSSHTGAGISELRKELVKVALSQPYMNESVPRLFLDFEERLMEKRTRERLNILDWDVVSGIAQAQGLYEDKHVRQAVNFLNDIGSIQYFDTEFLRQKVVINPKWIVDVMACVVSVKNSHIQKGQLKKSDVPIVWANFDPALHDWLLKLTEAFDLTYPMQDDCNMVPCLLPEETPSYVFPPPTAEGSNCSLARFIYQFEYLPAGLFNRAQVRLFEFTDSATVWKRGSLLRKNNHEAVIVMDDKQRLSISVFGPKPENVLFMIRDVIDGLIKETFQGVHYEEILPCPECLNAPGATEAEISLIRVATVRKASSRQVAFLQCSQEFHILNLSQLLAAVPPVSTADFDHQLEQSLLQLRRVRLEMTRDLCLLFSSADYPDDPGSADEMARLINPEIVVQKMEAEGLTCYSTDQDMPEDRMLQIKDCKVLLVFLSKAFADDEACRGMFTNAKNILRKRMIFISVGADKSWRDSNEVAFLVGTDKYIDFTANKKDVLASKFTELISDAKAAVATARQPESDLLGKDVFISYCWANSHDAASKGTRNSVLGCPDSDPRKVAARLQEKGIHCWLDVKDIGARSLFEDISDGLRQCSVVLAFASNEYQRSANCMMEFRFACRNLRKPVVMAIVGESLDFKTQELGMLSIGLDEFDFRQQVKESHFERLVERLKKLLEEQKKKKKEELEEARGSKSKASAAAAATATSSGPLTRRGLFREEAELAQRRFLKQFQQHHEMPRLLVLDFADVAAFAESSAGEDSADRQLDLMKVLCENEQGWHVHGPGIELHGMSSESRALMLSSTSAYLLRIYSLLQTSGIPLNCLDEQRGAAGGGAAATGSGGGGGSSGGSGGTAAGGEGGTGSGAAADDSDDFMQLIRSEASSTSQSFVEAYHNMQNLFLRHEGLKSVQASGLAKCQLGSGKLVWLCPEHQRSGNGRVTVLPPAESGGVRLQQVVTEGDRVLKEALDGVIASSSTTSNKQKREADLEKYKKYLEEQEKAAKTAKDRVEGGAASRARLQRRRTSVLIGQEEAAALSSAKPPSKPRRSSARRQDGASAATDGAEATLTASQVSLKKNRSKVCSVQ